MILQQKLTAVFSGVDFFVKLYFQLFEFKNTILRIGFSSCSQEPVAPVFCSLFRSAFPIVSIIPCLQCSVIALLKWGSPLVIFLLLGQATQHPQGKGEKVYF